MKPCNFTFALRHCSNVDRYSIAAEDAIELRQGDTQQRSTLYAAADVLSLTVV
jgi:hypothetical protein